MNQQHKIKHMYGKSVLITFEINGAQIGLGKSVNLGHKRWSVETIKQHRTKVNDSESSQLIKGKR